MKIVAKTSRAGNSSPYAKMANNMSEAQKQMAQNTIHPSEVAKVIVRAYFSQ